MAIAIAMAHGHATKWLQTSIQSLKATKNSIEADVFVAATWPGHSSLKAITETDLGDNVTIIPCKARIHSHATGLDEILDTIADNPKYDMMFCMETDCRAVQDGWLDWFLSHMGPGVGMAGFFWEEGTNHYNINPSGTLYRKDMLVAYHKEIKANKQGVFYHPRGDKLDTVPGMDSSIKNVVGVFSETRGIQNPNEMQLEGILKGVPEAAWFEPGAWLYYRSLGEYESVSVPCDHVYQVFGVHVAPEATYYGGKGDPVYIHYWGGTRAWDHLKHPVNDMFVKGCSPFWLDREDYIWRQTVPEKYHGIVAEIYKELGLEGMGYNKA
jgi:hypothetical protein